MAPLGDLPSGLSYTGTGRADAFSIASTSAFELKQAVRFLAHEYMPQLGADRAGRDARGG